MTVGHAFPTGVSVNHCAAHDSPNPGCGETEIFIDDCVKVDYGIAVNGEVSHLGWFWFFTWSCFWESELPRRFSGRSEEVHKY